MSAGADRSSHVRTVLADDDPTVLAALVSLFSAQAGVEVVATATSGGELVDAIAAHRPALVVTDVYMPGGGEELFDRLATIDPKPYVIAMSGKASPRLRERLTATGADRLLHKGIDDPLSAALDVIATGTVAR